MPTIIPLMALTFVAMSVAAYFLIQAANAFYDGLRGTAISFTVIGLSVIFAATVIFCHFAP